MIGVAILIIKEALESATAEVMLKAMKRTWKWVCHPFHHVKKKVSHHYKKHVVHHKKKK